MILIWLKSSSVPRSKNTSYQQSSMATFNTFRLRLNLSECERWQQ